jgi:hypothetical protein
MIVKRWFILFLLNTNSTEVVQSNLVLVNFLGNVYYRQVVYYLAGDLCWKWDFGKHQMFTNARLFTIDKFTNPRFDCSIIVNFSGGHHVVLKVIELFHHWVICWNRKIDGEKSWVEIQTCFFHNKQISGKCRRVWKSHTFYKLKWGQPKAISS